ncbi:MAG: metal-dependent transcriptional regulator [Saccharofermentanales bacterium]|jgi:DtxR family Mn-dependent transcriptional regulator
MGLLESGQNYLENIYILQQKQGFVRSVDLANAMGFSKPSVSRAVHLLADDGYLEFSDSGNLILTESGQKVAKNIYDRHMFLAEYFMAMGVSEETAYDDACRLEYHISEETMERLRLHTINCALNCPKASSEKFFNFNKEKIQDLENFETAKITAHDNK